MRSSMGNMSCWEGLIAAVKEFAKRKSQISLIQHAASCITFTEKASLAFTTSLSQMPMEQLSAIRPSGGTSFSAALAKVVELVEQANSHSAIVVIFMSDGKNKYPEDQVANLLKDSNFKKLDSFWAIGFEENSAILRKMADSMKGKGQYRNPKDIDSLINEYIEVASST